jgi:fructokinase
MILISGEALVDLIPDRVKDGAYDAVLGGSPFNVAIGLARLGAPAAFVSRISNDANGEAFAAALAKAGVDLSFVARVAEPTTLAFVMRGTAATGARYSFYLDSTSFDGHWPFPKQWPANGRHLHVGSISALDARHGESVVAALTAARRHATTSFDPNIRPLVTPDRDKVMGLVERQLALASFVKASDEDLHWLYPDRDPETSIAAWAQRGPLFAVVTRGAEGAVAFRGGERVEAQAPQVAGDRRDGRRWRARRERRRADRAAAAALARLRGDGGGDHLHPQGLRSADPRRGRGAAGAERVAVFCRARGVVPHYISCANPFFPRSGSRPPSAARPDEGLRGV